MHSYSEERETDPVRFACDLTKTGCETDLRAGGYKCHGRIKIETGSRLVIKHLYFRLIIRTPVALKIGLAMATLDGTELIFPAPWVP